MVMFAHAPDVCASFCYFSNYYYLYVMFRVDFDTPTANDSASPSTSSRKQRKPGKNKAASKDNGKALFDAARIGDKLDALAKDRGGGGYVGLLESWRKDLMEDVREWRKDWQRRKKSYKGESRSGRKSIRGGSRSGGRTCTIARQNLTGLSHDAERNTTDILNKRWRLFGRRRRAQRSVLHMKKSQSLELQLRRQLFIRQDVLPLP